MKLHIFAVRDIKTDQYGNPMFMISSGQAIRGFQDEINRAAEDNMLHKHPNDFELYTLGTFDTDTGTFETHQPKSVITGAESVIRKQ